jgi:hypothetical protein
LLALTKRSVKLLFAAAVMTLACLAIAMAHPYMAHAEECGGNLPSSDWTSCGIKEENTVVWGGINSGGGNHDDCVAAMTYNGGKYEWPWGWHCGTGSNYSEWPAGVLDFPSFYNDSGTEYNMWLQGY